MNFSFIIIFMDQEKSSLSGSNDQLYFEIVISIFRFRGHISHSDLMFLVNEISMLYSMIEVVNVFESLEPTP